MLHGGEVILAGVGLQAAVDFGGKLSPECGVLPGVRVTVPRLRARYLRRAYSVERP